MAGTKKTKKRQRKRHNACSFQTVSSPLLISTQARNSGSNFLLPHVKLWFHSRHILALHGEIKLPVSVQYFCNLITFFQNGFLSFKCYRNTHLHWVILIIMPRLLSVSVTLRQQWTNAYWQVSDAKIRMTIKRADLLYRLLFVQMYDLVRRSPWRWCQVNAPFALGDKKKKKWQ